MTAFLSLQTALIAALTASAPLSGVLVKANTDDPIPEGVESAVLVKLERSEQVGDLLGALEWVSVFSLEAVVRVPTGDDAVSTVDPLLNAVWNAAHSIALPSVSEIAADPQISWQNDRGATRLGSAALSLIVRHRTHAYSLTPWVE